MVARIPSTVMVIGESLVDIVETIDGRAVEAPGGSPLNVAITLGRLGVATTLLTALGDDDRAARIEAHLADSGVAVVAGARRLPRTSTATARMQPDGSARYEFDLRWEPPDVPPGSPATVVHAGSVGLFLEPGAALVRRHLALAGESTLVTLDPNVRPSLVPERPLTVARFEELLALAHVVKLSDEDAAWLYPDLDVRGVLRHLLDRGPALVVLTSGAEGAVIATTETALEVPAPPTSVVDTIGAGDSFMGALIEQIVARGLTGHLVARRALRRDELGGIGGRAATVAALTVGRRGADPPRTAEIPPGRGSSTPRAETGSAPVPDPEEN